MTARLDGRVLTAEGNQESAAAPAVPVKEILTLSADGKTLSVVIESTGSVEKTPSTFIYTKTQAAEPCKSWPTPCKIP